MMHQNADAAEMPLLAPVRGAMWYTFAQTICPNDPNDFLNMSKPDRVIPLNLLILLGTQPFEADLPRE